MYGGTLTGVSTYSYSPPGFAGNTSASITLTFTASVANPVLAWGGHISTRTDWGADNSAVSISGSPYHTRLGGLDGSGGPRPSCSPGHGMPPFARSSVTRAPVPRPSLATFPSTTHSVAAADRHDPALGKRVSLVRSEQCSAFRHGSTIARARLLLAPIHARS